MITSNSKILQLGWIVPKFTERCVVAEFIGARTEDDLLSSGSCHKKRRTTSVHEGTTIRTLLAADLVDSTNFIREVGDEKAAEVFAAHDRLFRELNLKYRGREIDKTDGFLLVFHRPVEAAQYALAYQAGLLELSEEYGVPIRSRVGIHLGEIVLHENSPADIECGAKSLEAEGLAKPTTMELMSLATGGQILLSETAHDFARNAEAGCFGVKEDLGWKEHGRYRFKNLDSPICVYEVGRMDSAPFIVPPSSEKCWRLADEAASKSTVRLRVLIASVLILTCLVAGLMWWMQPSSKPQSAIRAVDKIKKAPLSPAQGVPVVAMNRSAVVVPVAREIFVDFNSVPLGAEIWIDGRKIGFSPFRWAIESKLRAYQVSAKKSGYRTASKRCSVTPSGIEKGEIECHFVLSPKNLPNLRSSQEQAIGNKGLKAKSTRARIHVIE